LLQNSVEDVILLEYMRHIDHGEHIDSSTYRNPCHYNFSSFITEEHKQVYVMMGMVTCSRIREETIQSLIRKGHSHSCLLLMKIKCGILDHLTMLILDQQLIYK
jgi:hypothetical protein